MAGQLAASSFYSNYITTGTASASTSYLPTSAGQTIYLSGTLGVGLGTWYPASAYPVVAPFKGQVINWGGKVYYQPSDKMRALVDALRLV